AVVWSYAAGSAYLCGSGRVDRFGGCGCELFSGTTGRLHGPDGDAPQRIEPPSGVCRLPEGGLMQIPQPLGAAQPCLIMNDVNLADSSGGVALWIGPGHRKVCWFTCLQIRDAK